jgi:hypothetical protein
VARPALYARIAGRSKRPARISARAGVDVGPNGTQGANVGHQRTSCACLAGDDTQSRAHHVGGPPQASPLSWDHSRPGRPAGRLLWACRGRPGGDVGRLADCRTRWGERQLRRPSRLRRAFATPAVRGTRQPDRRPGGRGVRHALRDLGSRDAEGGRPRRDGRLLPRCHRLHDEHARPRLRHVRREADGGTFPHRLAANAWESAGRPQRPSGTAGLRHSTLDLRSRDALDTTIARMERAGLPVERQGDGAVATDPSGNRLLLTVPTGR